MKLHLDDTSYVECERLEDHWHVFWKRIWGEGVGENKVKIWLNGGKTYDFLSFVSLPRLSIISCRDTRGQADECVASIRLDILVHPYLS